MFCDKNFAINFVKMKILRRKQWHVLCSWVWVPGCKHIFLLVVVELELHGVQLLFF